MHLALEEPAETSEQQVELDSDVDDLRFVVAADALPRLKGFLPLQLFWHPWRGLQLISTRQRGSCDS